MSLKQQALKGVIWSAVERFSVQGIQFVLSFIIARQLFPSDYGLIAMLTIFMAIAQSFIDSGFSNALIQKQDRTQTDYSTVFYFNIVVGAIAYLILVLCSPLIADFYNQPLLRKIVKWVGLNLIISSFSTVQRAKLTIELNFKKQAVISLFSAIISSSITIYMAYNGYGVWSLVAQGIINGIFNTLLLWTTTKWLPSIEFSIQSFKQLFSFGSKILASGLLHTIYVNLYTLVIGKTYTIQELGLYNRAHSIALYPAQNLVGLINRVLYPVLCKIQNDINELSDKFILFLRFSLFIVCPIITVIYVLANPLVKLILTDKWLECVPILKILCIAYVFDPIQNLSTSFLYVNGKGDYAIRAEIIKKIIAVIILFVTIYYTIETVCYGLIAYAFIDVYIITSYTKKISSKITLKNYLKELYPVFFQSIIMGMIVYIWTIIFSDIYIQVIGGLIIGIVSYLLLSRLFAQRELSELTQFCKRIFY